MVQCWTTPGRRVQCTYTCTYYHGSTRVRTRVGGGGAARAHGTAAPAVASRHDETIAAACPPHRGWPKNENQPSQSATTSAHVWTRGPVRQSRQRQSRCTARACSHARHSRVNAQPELLPTSTAAHFPQRQACRGPHPARAATPRQRRCRLTATRARSGDAVQADAPSAPRCSCRRGVVAPRRVRGCDWVTCRLCTSPPSCRRPWPPTSSASRPRSW